MAAVQRVECGHAHVKQLLQCLAWVPSIGMNFIHHINPMFGQMGQWNIHKKTFQLYFRLKMWMKQLKRIRCVWSVKWVSGSYSSRSLNLRPVLVRWASIRESFRLKQKWWMLLILSLLHVIDTICQVTLLLTAGCCQSDFRAIAFATITDTSSAVPNSFDL